MTRRVLVIGPGAVGTFLGAILARGGAEVTLLGRGDAPPGRTGNDHVGSVNNEFK